MKHMAICDVCFRHCDIPEGKSGFCKGRTCKDGKVIPFNYGKITSIALDPIEKKPLRRFYPGSKIVSIGSFGCNLNCPFCQNYEISWSEEVEFMKKRARYISPEEILKIAKIYIDKGNIGVAYTYNEPLIGYEYVLDCARIISKNGLKNVLVSNGMVELPILDKLLPYIDAMNIDLKSFDEDFYSRLLKGNRDQVLKFIEAANRSCHIELTTLIIPGENDSVEHMRDLSSWIASLENGKNIPLHISRFFPAFKMTDRKATDIDLVYRLADVAKEKLNYVYTGNC